MILDYITCRYTTLRDGNYQLLVCVTLLEILEIYWNVFFLLEICFELAKSTGNCLTVFDCLLLM